MNGFIITFVSFSLLMMLSVFSPVKEWRKSFARKSSVGLVISILFFTLYITGGQTSGLNAATIDTPRIIKMIILLSLLSFSGYALLTSSTNIRFGSGMLPYLLYIIFAFMSFYYSSNALLSLWKATEILTILMCFLWIKGKLKSLDNVIDIINIIWLILLYITLSAVLGGIIEPDLSYVRQTYGTGIFASEFWGVFPRINPNSLSQIGALTAISGFISFITLKDMKAKTPSIIIFLLGFGVLLIAHSRTSLLAMFVCIFMILLYSKKKIIALSILIPSVTILIVFGAQTIISDYVLRGQSTEVFSSLSGRTEFWPLVWSAFLESPIVGHGYYAGHRELQLDKYSIVASSVDNTYLEVLVNLGVVGLALFLFSVFLLLHSLYKYRLGNTPKNTHKNWNIIWLSITSIFIMIFIRSMTGPSFQNLHMNLILYMLVTISIAYSIRNLLSNNTPESKDINIVNNLPKNKYDSVRLKPFI